MYILWFLQMTFVIFLLLLLMDFSVSSFFGNVACGFFLCYLPVRYLFVMVPVRRFVGSMLFTKIVVSYEEPMLYIHK
jgi:hypothetical protein